MKKFIGLLLVVTIALTLVSCNGNSDLKDLDFKSVLDTETGTILSLGDPKAVFDEALGEVVVEAYGDGVISSIYSYLSTEDVPMEMMLPRQMVSI